MDTDSLDLFRTVHEALKGVQDEIKTLHAIASTQGYELAQRRDEIRALSNRVESLTRLVASAPGMREAFASVMDELREHSVRVEP